MVNTPIPHSLRAESLKAAKILRDFTMPSAKSGPDKIIPAGILVKAEGLAILTVVKIGFLVTARGGSGIVIARLGNRKWSAPSAIGIAGLGGGFEAGAEVTDFVLILTRKSAVDAFSKGGNLTLGGNFTIAAGPLGRNVEGDVSVRSPAAIYTYSKTKGLFAGISIEGSYLIERKDANKRFYCRDIRAYEILSGEIDTGAQCKELYDILEHHEDMYEKVLDAKAKQAATAKVPRSVRGSSMRSSSGSPSKRDESKYGEYDSSYKGSWADRDGFDYDVEEESAKTRARTKSMSSAVPRRNPPPKSATSGDISRMARTQPSRHSESSGARPKTSSRFTDAWDAPSKCKALWKYDGQLPCDLSFKPGDVIEIRTRTHTQDDWWEGSIDGRVGIFPANYVQLL